VLFVEDQINAENITAMADIQINFQTNLEDKLLKLAETIDLSRDQVNSIIDNMTTTTTASSTTATTEVGLMNLSGFCLLDLPARTLLLSLSKIYAF
jgi:predicted DNA-binding ArsR family transcriptional regulator